MRQSRRSTLGMSLLVAALGGCTNTPPARVSDVLPEPQGKERVLPVRFQHPAHNGRYQHGSHSHLFSAQWVGTTETITVVHLPISLSRKLLYLVLRKQHIEELLREFREYMSAPVQVQYELELRLIPDEIRQIREKMQRAVQVREETDEV